MDPASSRASHKSPDLPSAAAWDEAAEAWGVADGGAAERMVAVMVTRPVIKAVFVRTNTLISAPEENM
ncbi:hypothetical protein GCM10010402_14830 [Actinomadura luteofluorescens]